MKTLSESTKILEKLKVIERNVEAIKSARIIRGIRATLNNIEKDVTEMKKRYPLHGVPIGKPFADFKDMDDCISQNQDADDPAALCAYIHHQATGKWPQEKQLTKRDISKLEKVWSDSAREAALAARRAKAKFGVSTPRELANKLDNLDSSDPDYETGEKILSQLQEAQATSRTQAIPKMDDEKIRSEIDTMVSQIEEGDWANDDRWVNMSDAEEYLEQLDNSYSDKHNGKYWRYGEEGKE